MHSLKDVTLTATTEMSVTAFAVQINSNTDHYTDLWFVKRVKNGTSLDSECNGVWFETTNAHVIHAYVTIQKWFSCTLLKITVHIHVYQLSYIYICVCVCVNPSAVWISWWFSCKSKRSSIHQQMMHLLSVYSKKPTLKTPADAFPLTHMYCYHPAKKQFLYVNGDLPPPPPPNQIWKHSYMQTGIHGLMEN